MVMFSCEVVVHELLAWLFTAVALARLEAKAGMNSLQARAVVRRERKRHEVEHGLSIIGVVG